MSAWICLGKTLIARGGCGYGLARSAISYSTGFLSLASKRTWGHKIPLRRRAHIKYTLWPIYKVF